MPNLQSDLSEIGYWSEIKLEIIREYASAYSRILAAQTQPRLRHVYIDGFSGSGVHVAKSTKDLVWGSPMSALFVKPPFKEYHFIDLDEGNIDALEMQVRSRTRGPYDPDSTFFYNDDCNQVLLSDVFPRVKYVAGFDYVPAPMPMRNSKGAVLYYLYFASQKPVASRIVRDIFKKYQN